MVFKKTEGLIFLQNIFNIFTLKNDTNELKKRSTRPQKCYDRY